MLKTAPYTRACKYFQKIFSRFRELRIFLPTHLTPNGKYDFGAFGSISQKESTFSSNSLQLVKIRHFLFLNFDFFSRHKHHFWFGNFMKSPFQHESFMMAIGILYCIQTNVCHSLLSNIAYCTCFLIGYAWQNHFLVRKFREIIIINFNMFGWSLESIN